MESVDKTPSMIQSVHELSNISKYGAYRRCRLELHDTDGPHLLHIKKSDIDSYNWVSRVWNNVAYRCEYRDTTLMQCIKQFRMSLDEEK